MVVTVKSQRRCSGSNTPWLRRAMRITNQSDTGPLYAALEAEGQSAYQLAAYLASLHEGERSRRRDTDPMMAPIMHAMYVSPTTLGAKWYGASLRMTELVAVRMLNQPR